MIIFENWSIRQVGELAARQFDNLVHTLSVSGDIPDGWEWHLLVRSGDDLNIITLNPDQQGLSVDLTEQMLSRDGYCQIQLRGIQGELVRHTNMLTVFIPASLSGNVQWPEVPSEFQQAEARIAALNSHPPKPGPNGKWQIYNPTLREYESSDIPLPAEGGGGIYSDEISTIKVLDRGAYEALEEKDPATLYLIRG